MKSDQTPRRPARLHLPVGGRPVADGMDAPFPVLELEFLLFLRQQARVDARILDEFAALDHALDPGFEQRLLHPFRDPSRRRRIRLQRAPVVEGDGEDEPVAMRPGAYVDGGAALPDRKRFARCARRRSGNARPRDGLLRERGPEILADLEPTLLAPLPGARVHGGGGRDREARLTSNEAGEAGGRRRHVPSPARRPGTRAVVGPAARIRLVVRFVEEGRLRRFPAFRGGVEAGEAGVDGMQHPRGIAVQRRRPEAPFPGRPDELPAHPIDQSLPGFDVHHGQLVTAGHAS